VAMKGQRKTFIEASLYSRAGGQARPLPLRQVYWAGRWAAMEAQVGLGSGLRAKSSLAGASTLDAGPLAE